MNKESARKIIKNTFQNSYDKERFIYFINNLLNQYDKSKAFSARDYNSSDPNNCINTYECIGSYTDPEGKKIDILIVNLKKESTLKNARTAQRNFIARYLKSCDEKDAGLVAFVPPDDEEDWRFSFVKMEYKFEKTLNGNVKVKEEFTPLRYSFLVGKNESSHTAQSCFVPILENDYNPKLHEIEDAFSIEKVTKEFFKEYKTLFDILIKELNSNHSFIIEASKSNIITENFAKKLLGQIVFLYFLQKKGWLGVSPNKTWGEGDKCFLRHIFEKSKVENKNFFNDYLEYLFYDTLNNPRLNMIDPSYAPYFKSRIPFLNGGLFEPEYDWENSFLYIDDKIFEKILDVFDQYNFTVKEDEPLEKEVAVDPEMLGKVFENLLEENLRKGKGTYYTPREIVHYMCRESLVNYLVTESKIGENRIRKLINWNMIITREDIIKEKENKNNINIKSKPLVFWEGEAKQLEAILKDIKIVDPACGSGAFLVSLLHEIVRTRQVLQLFLDEKATNEYQLKKETIQNCIYGVDIDPGAIEIAKLRLWLSLIVDYEVEEIEPLPNLDYKIMQGNSLIEELVLGDTSIKLFDIGVIKSQQVKKNLFDNKIQEDLFGNLEIQRKIIKDLNNLHREYFEIRDLNEKRNKKLEIDKIEQDLIEGCVKKEIERLEQESKNIGNYIVPGTKMTKRDAEEYSKNISKQLQINKILDDYRKSGIRPFFLWRLCFADVFDKKNGFDIVIANPPYVSTKGVHATPKKDLRRHYGFVDDLYSHFFFRSFEILKSKGILSFITSNTFMTINTKTNIRKLLQSKKLIELIKTTDVFDAMVSPAITIAQNIHITDNHSFKFKDALFDFNNPKIYETQIDIFRNAVNFVFFPPTPFNMAFYNKYNSIVRRLHEKWWPKIASSKKIAENFSALEENCNEIQLGDIALLGTLTDGGVGLQTGNNGRFVGVRENTKQAKNIIDSRPKKIFEAVKAKNISLPIKSKEDAKHYLREKSEKEIIKLFDELKEKYGKDIFGQGYLFRIISDDEIAVIDELTEEEKKNGIDKTKPHYVPYDKGDKDGNRWYLETPFVIDWSKEAVKIFQTDPKARWQGYDFYFKEGFCWNLINGTRIHNDLKFRFIPKSINDVGGMKLCSFNNVIIPNYYLICLGNSRLMSYYSESFINFSVNFQINDARQLPIIIPNEKQLSEFKDLFDKAVRIKKLQFSNQISKEEAVKKLNLIQEQLDKMVYELYGLEREEINIVENF